MRPNVAALVVLVPSPAARWMCRIALGLPLLCSMAGTTRGDLALTLDAPPVTDNPLSPAPLYPVVGGMTSGDVTTTVHRVSYTGTLLVEYMLSRSMMSEIGPGDTLVFHGFGGLRLGGSYEPAIQFATPPWGATLAAVPPVPFLTTWSDGQDAIAFSDFRRLVEPSGPVLIPLMIRIATDGVDFAPGRGELYRGGELISSFDTLVPIAVPEPWSLPTCGVGTFLAAGYAWRRKRPTA